MSHERFHELMAEAESLGNTSTGVAVLEQAVREADRLNDADLAFDARNELVTAATFSGLREKAMVAYAWCLSYYDRNRDELGWYLESDLLWKYKWIVAQITNFPQISRNQILGLQDDLERRYVEAGYNARPAHFLRHQNARDMGDLQSAAEFRKLWKANSRDELADCEACECSSAVEFDFALKHDKRGMRAVEPILSGRMGCATVPHTTYAKVLMPLVRLGRGAEAARLQERGYRLISKNPDFLPSIAEHILYLAHVGDFNKAVRMFGRHFAWAFETAVAEYRFRFYLAGAVLLEAVAAKSNRKRKLRMPADFPLKSDDDSYQPGELADWLWNETRLLAERFNARNENDYYTRHMTEARAQAGLSEELS